MRRQLATAPLLLWIVPLASNTGRCTAAGASPNCRPQRAGNRATERRRQSGRVTEPLSADGRALSGRE